MRAAVAPLAPIADAGRQAILAAVNDFASRGVASPLMRYARQCWAAQALADTTDDADLVELASTAAAGAQSLMVELPAIDAGGLALKLACLVGELLRDFDESPKSVNQLALAAGSLADAVVLAGGAITLPAGAKEGIREGDTATAAAWLARQAAYWRD